MKLKSLRLRNISCFEDIELNFCHETTGEPCKWVVLLGENGTGKSTLCQMIACSLFPQRINDVAGNINFGLYFQNLDLQIEVFERAMKFLRSSRKNEYVTEKKTFLNSLVVCNSDNLDDKSYILDFYVTDLSVGIGMIVGVDGFKDRIDVSSLIYGPGFSKNSGWFFGGYGSGRYGGTLIQEKNFPASDSRVADRFGSLFSGGYITNPREWISDLYLKTIHPDSTDEDKLMFGRAIKALNSVLPNATFKEVTKEGEVMMEDSGSLVSINRLSDGYKSTLSWVLDLTRRLCDAFPPDKFPDLESPLHAPGVVLVDEIDLHLHPRWQRKVVEMIRSTFPNIQFIVTTHSPFVAQDMTKDDKLIVLKRGEDGAVNAEHGMGFVKRWRADQILTSWLFDLETTRDGDAPEEETEYQALLEAEVSGKLSEEQKSRLRELKLRLDKDPRGETLSDQEIYAAADALSAALLANDPD